MKRFRRRTLAVIVGLALGYLAAGFLPGSLSQTSVSLAQSHDDHGHGAESHAPPAVPHHHAGAAGDHHEAAGAGHDTAHSAAVALVPKPDQIRWYRAVLFAVGGLFVAAIVLGIPALKLRGPLPPDPADLHDADAAHDEHAAHDDKHPEHQHSHTPAHTGPAQH